MPLAVANVGCDHCSCHDVRHPEERLSIIDPKKSEDKLTSAARSTASTQSFGAIIPPIIRTCRNKVRS
jgi:hypothetical protein